MHQDVSSSWRVRDGRHGGADSDQERSAKANEVALAKVRADKEREASDGHDGTWVAHPGLVPMALEVFDRLMPTPNQLTARVPDVDVTAKDLLADSAGHDHAKPGCAAT